MPREKTLVILFVEGETEKEFYEALLKFYRQNSKTAILDCKIYNVKGISRFENKVTRKLKHEILPKYINITLKVICCYDTDIFELAQKPPINWSSVKKKVNELGIANFFEVRAVRMIEDWFLRDIRGLCHYLDIAATKRVDGKNGHDKMKNLFKKGNKPKIYQKGSGSHKFIPSLNILIIRNGVKEELCNLEKALGVNL